MNVKFIFDITFRNFKTESDFIKIAECYPSSSMLLVTPEQKQTCAGFSGNYTRYVDSSDVEITRTSDLDPLYLKRDILVFDGPSGDWMIVVAKELETIGKKVVTIETV